MYQGPLFLLLRDGETITYNQTLDNRFSPSSNTDKYTRELIHYSRSHPQQGSMEKTTITCGVFKSRWKKMNERTLSGLSGIDFHHMKACAQEDKLSDFEASLPNISSNIQSGHLNSYEVWPALNSTTFRSLLSLH